MTYGGVLFNWISTPSLSVIKSTSIYLGFLFSLFVLAKKLFDNDKIGVLSMILFSLCHSFIAKLLSVNQTRLLLGLIFINLGLAQFSDVYKTHGEGGWKKLGIFSLFAFLMNLSTGFAYLLPLCILVLSVLYKKKDGRKKITKGILLFVLPVIMIWTGITFFAVYVQDYMFFTSHITFRGVIAPWFGAGGKLILLAGGGFFLVFYWLFYQLGLEEINYGSRVAILWLLSLLLLLLLIFLTPIGFHLDKLAYYFISPLIVGFAYTVVDALRGISRTIKELRVTDFEINGKIIPLLFFALFLSFTWLTFSDENGTEIQRETEIHITSKASGGLWVWHGLAIDSDLRGAFPASQPEKVIGKAGGSFSYTTTVQLTLGKHRLEYGAAKYDGSLPAPWQAKIFVNGEKIAEGKVKEKQHLKVEFTVEEPPFSVMGLFQGEEKFFQVVSFVVAIFVVIYAAYLIKSPEK